MLVRILRKLKAKADFSSSSRRDFNFKMRRKMLQGQSRMLNVNNGSEILARFEQMFKRIAALKNIFHAIISHI